MRRTILILLLALSLQACATKTFVGKVMEKRMIQEYVEVIPPGYRTSCGVTFTGKYECGFKFFITTEIKVHPAEYYLTLNDGKCTVEVSTDRETWNSTKRLDTSWAKIPVDSCKEEK